jgi:serine/threonine protein phosphatase PrpC
MLARWFDRNGIGQILAPDENVAKEPVPDEAKSAIWQILAPDPNFTPPPQVPPRDAFLNMPTSEGQVICMHCNKWTSVGTPRRDSAGVSTPVSTPQIKTPSAQSLFTPSPSMRRAEKSRLEYLVLSAARETTASMVSPPQVREAREKVFRLCGSSKPISDKLQKRLRNLIKKNPTLIHARATDLGQTAPDGYTPLMAAVNANHQVAVQIILDKSPKGAPLDVGLQGQTALHIAAEKGHVNLVNLLLPYFQPGGMSSPPPVDLIGRTPLGRAICSPNPTARKRQRELESSLFSPGDLSVFGEPKPETDRTGKDDALQITFGASDMPGIRVIMEDAVCTCSFQFSGKSYFLAGVFDGHGDAGKVSQFVADSVPSILQSNMTEGGAEMMDWNDVWTKTCLQVDQKLKEADLAGGSTGVMALITEDLIVVANVGDSRAILIQSQQKTDTAAGLEDKMAALSVAASSSSPTKNDDATPPAAENSKNEASADAANQESAVVPAEESKPQNAEVDNTASKPPSLGPIAIALSEDHKPDLEGEQSRIQKAGFNVVPVTFMEDGKEVTIHKVSKGGTDQLAVSRAFGDFEYKSNTTLSPEEQAVAAVADVRVQKRDHDCDRFLVLACDGVWDVMDNDNVMDFVLRQAEVRSDMTDTVLPEVGDALLRESLNRGSRDNMTTVILALSGESEKIRPVIKGKTLDFTT